MNVPPLIQHEMLVANAGSGKTYRLTVRTITLLALGARPEKIAALTFTRKAAGEFLEEVFLRLAGAAIDPTKLAHLQRDTQLPELDARRCRMILADLVAHLHRLNMGTIDSLFGKIARAFPLETGLAGDFSILSDNDQQSAHREVLASLFRENAQDEGRFRSFLEIVRQQSRRQSEREVFQTLLGEARQLHGKFLRHPTGQPWGHADSIWPDGSEILAAGKHVEAAEAFAEAIFSTHLELDPGAKAKWESYLSDVCSHVEEQAWGEPLKKFVKEKLCNCKTDSDRNLDYLPTGNARNARVYLHEKVLSARRVLLLCLLRPRIEQLIDRSRSLHTMIRGFEDLYARNIRNQGRLTFEDITLALASQIDSPEWRATVGYRLDAQLDHWLLDEFQDTSRPQWKVLGALIDEVVQDESGQRSFFYVGDTKQAIYAWRGGDPKLFFEIRDYYNAGKDFPIVAAPPLNVSFRSDPEIIEVVNTVFGNLTVLEEPLGLPKKTVADWNIAWNPHEVAEVNQSNNGYFRWTARDAKGESEEDAELDAVDHEILTILHEVKPWLRGWSCAALKRDNKKLVNLAALLQAQGVPVTIEGKSNPCLDNPLGAAVLAAFRLAASPEDGLSLALITSSQLGECLLSDGLAKFRERTFRLISEIGFAGTIQRWTSFLDLTEEPFLISRSIDLLAAAEQYDAVRLSSDDIGSFVRFLENYQRQDPEGSDSVRLMTIHQAKGLTFDMVIVSGLDSSPLASDYRPGTMALQPNRHQKLWGLIMPDADLARHDSILHQAATSMLAESTYGELCAIYVAMTRPRHGLYVVTQKLSPKTTARTFARMLDLTLGQTDPSYERGNRSWYESRSEIARPVENLLTTIPQLPKPRDQTPQAISPSSFHLTQRSTGAAPTTFFADAAALGTEVHAWLARIEWLDFSTTSTAELSAPAWEMLDHFLAGSGAREIFTEPSHPVLLWRERPFDLLLDGEWLTGVFDRVEVALDPAGAPLSAVIYDFKTDAASLEELETTYAGQLSRYEKAVALLLGLERFAVSSRVVPVA